MEHVHLQAGNAAEAAVGRQERQVVLQGVGGDPADGSGEGAVGGREASAQVGVDFRRAGGEGQQLEGGDIGSRLEDGGRGNAGGQLAMDVFTRDVRAKHGRIIPQHQGFNPLVATAQQFQRSGIKQGRHGTTIWPVWW